MKPNRLSALAALTLTTTTATAATSFLAPDNFATDPAAAAAEWDTFAATGDPDVFDATGMVATGTNAPTSGSATGNRLVEWAAFAGLLSPESIYTHDGAISFDATIGLAAPVNFARVSYALVDSGMGAPSPFPVAPTIAGATEIASGSYPDGVRSVVFYTDFDLGAPSTSFATTFGDIPVANTSFRSIEGIRLEGMSEAPDQIVIPEPGSAALALGALGAFALARRRR